MWFDKKKVEEKISTTLYDLTHLEINTIIKDEMSGSKAPASPRLLLYGIAKKYDEKIISIRDTYKDLPAKADECTDLPGNSDCVKLLSGKVPKGTGYNSFKVLSCRAQCLGSKLAQKKDTESVHEDGLDADIKMLKRIETISDDIRRILKKVDPLKKEIPESKVIPNVDVDKPKEINYQYDFDDEAVVQEFFTLKIQDAMKQELELDMRQFMQIKKANDIGTESIVLQTIIGIDGDITTRISQAFADRPIPFINDMHHEAIGISVKFWQNLVKVVVKLGKSIIKNLNI